MIKKVGMCANTNSRTNFKGGNAQELFIGGTHLTDQSLKNIRKANSVNNKKSGFVALVKKIFPGVNKAKTATADKNLFI